MATPISTLPLDELSDMYCTAYMLYTAKRNDPERWYWTLEAISTDMNLIFEAMKNKIPDSHQWEIEKIIRGETKPQSGIEPGQRFKHVTHPIELEIVQQEDGLWSARVFVSNQYANRGLFRSSTILEHYQRL